MEVGGRYVLLCSGSWCSLDLRSEIGNLPPCFLPIKNRRLFQLQIELINKSLEYDNLLVSLPRGFEISKKDLNLLESNEAQICWVDANLSLGSSIFSILQNKQVNSLTVLHGDTLPYSIFDSTDSVLIGKPRFEYHWDSLREDGSHFVLAGYFSFSDARLFQDCLIGTSFNFLSALRAYDASIPLRQTHATGWMDFGHTFSYLSSRAEIASSRAFNDLSIEDGYLQKRSADKIKIKREYNWYKSVPKSFKANIPSVQEIVEDQVWLGYSTEYLPLVGLNEIWVYGAMPRRFWENKIGLLLDLLTRFGDIGTEDNCGKEECTSNSWSNLIRDKTYARMQALKVPGVDWSKRYSLNGRPSPSLAQIQNICIQHLMTLHPKLSFFHGDFCLSNLFVDQRTNQVKMIDPRGIGLNERPVGPDLYDIGKLAHSIIGDYDHILAERFIFELNETEIHFDQNTDQDKLYLHDLFFSEIKSRFGYDHADVICLMIILFQSMVPLHYDNGLRQKSLLANSLRLYEWIDR